jgi:hypothetical protein
MRTFDLDQYWPTLTAASGADAASAAATADALRHIYSNAGSSAGTLSSWHVDLGVRTGNRLAGFPSRWGERTYVIRRQIGGFVASFDSQAALWLSLGFVAGMVAWHAVGFWGFVSNTVLNRETQRGSVAWQPPPRTDVKAANPITTGSLASYTPAPGACSMLTLDRATGATVAARCNDSDQPMRDAGRHHRGDRLSSTAGRLQDSTVWAATTEPSDPSPSTGTTASDFDLTLSAAR